MRVVQDIHITYKTDGNLDLEIALQGYKLRIFSVLDGYAVVLTSKDSSMPNLQLGFFDGNIDALIRPISNKIYEQKEGKLTDDQLRLWIREYLTNNADKLIEYVKKHLDPHLDRLKSLTWKSDSDLT